MVQETILQHWLVTRFILPFALMFFIIFAVLEKTKVLGGNKQINALISFVIGLIFVGVAYPTEVASNMILFLTVALVVMFVALLLWGLVSGGKEVSLGNDSVKWVVGIGIVVVVVLALLWATGVDSSAFDLLFKQSWSGTFWTNVIFIGVVAVALAVVIKNS